MKETGKSLEIRQESLPSGRGRAIFCRVCLPDHPRALLLVLHGLHEHSGRYEEAMRLLGGRGFASWAPDCPGHGRSPGVMGDLESIDRLLPDVERVRSRAASAFPRLPLFALGHSQGGLIALRYALEHQRSLSGLILSAPVVMLPRQLRVPRILQRLAPVLARLLPLLPVQDFPWQNASRDPQVIQAIRSDPLYYKGRIRARTGNELLRSMAVVQSRLPEIRLPVLVLNGDQDRIVDTDSADRVYAEVSSADRTHRVFAGLYHDLPREPEWRQVLALIADWMERRIP